MTLKRVAAEDERSLSDWIVITLTEAVAARDRPGSVGRRSAVGGTASEPLVIYPCQMGP